MRYLRSEECFQVSAADGCEAVRATILETYVFDRERFVTRFDDVVDFFSDGCFDGKKLLKSQKKLKRMMAYIDQWVFGDSYSTDRFATN